MTNNTLKLIRLTALGALSILGLQAQAQNYIVGDRGFILKTTDQGKTWQANNDSTAVTNLIGIRVAGKDTVYTSGVRQNNNGDLYRTVNGKTYRAVGGKNNVTIRDIGIFSNRRGIAIHSAYSTHPINQLRSTDNGATWGDDGNALGVSTGLDQIPNSNLGWSLYNSGRGIYKTTNGGNNWTNQFSVPSINSVERTSTSTILVADAGRAFIGNAGGSGFQPLVLPNVGTTKLRHVRASSNDSTVIAVGDLGYSAISNNAGRTWTKITIGINNLNFVEWATDSIVFVGGIEDAVGQLPLFKSTDAGSTWTRIPISAFGTRTRFTKDNYTLDMNGPLLGVMASGWRSNGNENAIYKTTNGGVTWTEYQGPVNNRNASCVKVFNADTMLVSHFGVFGSGEIYISTNGGANFNNVGTDRAGKYAFYFTSRLVGYAAGEIGIWKTTNGGFAWTQVTDGNAQSPLYDLNKGIAVGAFGKALSTTDYNTYTPLSPLGFVAGTFRDVQVLDQNHVFVAGDRGSVFRTTNSGSTWSYIGDTLKTGNLRSVHFTSVKQGWAVGDAGIVYSTKDSARTWTSATITTRDLNDVHFLNDSVGVIVGDSGLAWTTANAGVTWSRVFVGTRQNLNRAWIGDTLNQPTTKTFAYRADSASGFVGQTVVVPIRARDFSKIRGLQGSLTWDTSVARYVTVTRFGLNNLSIRNFNNATAATQGMLRFAWNDQSATLADDSVLFAVSFRLKTATNTTSLVSFNGTWLPAAIDSSRTTVPTFTTGGLLTVITSPTITTNKVVIGSSTATTEVCAGGTLKVPFTASAAFPAGNTFTAQLSTGAGVFTPAVTVGTLAGTNSDTILVTIPANAVTGTGYRIRVNGSLPIVTGIATTDTFTITATPARPTITAAGPLAICPTDSLQLSAPAGFGSYAWSNGATTQSIWVRGAGSYTVRAITTGGCTSVTSTALNTTAATQPNAPTITATGSTTRCDGDSVTLTAPVSNAYRWSTGATTRAIVVKTTGSYTLEVRGTATGCYSRTSAPTVVTINPLPATPNITVYGGSNDSLRADGSAGTTYLWFLNGTRVASLVGPQVKWGTAGTYTVRVVAAGCTSALSAPVVVTAIAGRLGLANTITLFPNPNNGQFSLSIKGHENEMMTIAITDLAGRILRTEGIMVNQENYTLPVDLGTLARGTYLVRVADAKGASAVLRTTVQ